MPDILNRQTSVSYSDGTPSATFTHDEAGNSLIPTISNGKGRLTSAWTSDGIGYSWSYEPTGQVAQQVASIDGVLYPSAFYLTDDKFSGSRSKIVYPDNLNINYGRDSIGRVTSIYKDASTTYAQYAYTAANGSLSQISWADGVTQQYLYDANGRLQENKALFSGNYVRWKYYYNASSQINQIAERIHKENPLSDLFSQVSYAYDQLGRLTTADHAPKINGAYVSDQINSFTYDLFGNMLNNQFQYPNTPALNRQTTFDVNPANNRLNSYTEVQNPIPVTYDNAGNMLTEGTMSYSYDGAGMMATVNSNGGMYRYDALKRRVKKTYVYQGESGTVTGNIISIYGPANELLADYKVENTPSGPNNSRTNYILNGAQSIAMQIVPASGTTSMKYLRRNHLNQIYDPQAYTSETALTSTHGQPYESGGDEQFPGHKEDPESGLHYNLARSYNPSMSRWTSADPITANAYDPQSLNKYSYNRNDPVNFVDALGEAIGDWWDVNAQYSANSEIAQWNLSWGLLQSEWVKYGK